MSHHQHHVTVSDEPRTVLRHFASVLAGVLACSTAHLSAQQTHVPPPVFRSEVIVTAERGEDDPARLSVPTVVVTREDIARVPGATVADLIDTLPGFQVLFASGSTFRPTTITRGFFGGGEAEYVKLLVDGIPMNDAESGLVDWRQISLSGVDRVEAMRGPASALYGDTAVGGVVQVFTRMSDARRARVRVEGGTMADRFLRGGLRHDVRAVTADLLGSYGASRGFRTQSHLREGSASATVQRSANERRWSVRGAFEYVDREEPGALTRAQIENDPGLSDPLFHGDHDERRKTYGAIRYASAGSRFAYNALGHASLHAGDRVRTLLLAPALADRGRRDISTSSVGASLGTSLLTRLGGASGSLRWGTDISRDRIDVSYGGPRTLGQRASMSGYAAHALDAHARVRFDAGIRWDRLTDEGLTASQSHTAWSPKAGATVFAGTVNRPVALFIHAARAFKAPTLDQMFDPRPFPDFRGGTLLLSNPSLRPQRGTTVEGGARQTTPRSRWEVVVYRMKMTDEIDFDPASFTYANIGRSTHAGVELDGTVTAGRHVAAGVSYAWTRVSPDESNARTQLKNIPRHLIRPTVTVTLPYQMFVHARYVRTAGAFADDANTVPLRDRSTLDVRLSKNVANATLRLDVFNVTDARYEEIGYVLSDFRGGVVPYFYPAPPVHARASLDFTF